MFVGETIYRKYPVLKSTSEGLYILILMPYHADKDIISRTSEREARHKILTVLAV